MGVAAALKNAIVGAFGYLVGIVIWIEGKFISLTMWAIINIAPYNNFINEESIIEAWAIVRDLCNMFFILVLLLIAFATILRYENYSIKRLLPKLIIMAVLINFSRMICGLIIDAGQIVMLTFVSAFADGGGNFSQLLGIDKYLSMVHGTGWTANINMVSTLGALVAAVVLMAIAAVVMVVVLAVLMIRIVMLWIYIVLSPLAFLLMAFPGGQKYASQWWRDFTTQVVAGPLLAFFIWLALITSAQVNHLSGSNAGGKEQCFGPSKILCPNEFVNFLIAIGMLVGGLIATSKLGGAIGAAAGAGMARINQGKDLMIKGGKRISGYDAVADRASSYMSMRKSARDDKIRQSVGDISGYVGKAKEWTGKKVSYVPRKVSGVFGKNKAERLGKEVDKDKETIKSFENIKDIRNNKNFSRQGFDYRHNTMTKKWDQYEKDTNNLKGEFSNSELQTNFTGTSDKEITRKEKEIKKASKRQEIVNKAGRIGLILAGGALGAATGGAGAGAAGAIFGGLYGAAAGAHGAPSIMKDIREAGKTDLDLVQNYEHKRVNEDRDPLKTARPEEIRKVMNDGTKNSFERVAAALELIAQKETSVEEIKKMRADLKIKKNFQGKVNNTFEGLVQQNYPAAAEGITKGDVRAKFHNESLTLKDIDTGSIKEYGQQIAEGMTVGMFKRQYKGLSDDKKEAVKVSLGNVLPEDAGAYKAREKLAHVSPINQAFVGFKDDEKEDFLRSLSMENITEFLNSNNKEKRESITQNIVINGKINEKVLADDVVRRIMSDNPTAKGMRDGLGIKGKKKKTEKPRPGTAPGARAGF